ncbi:protein of unknown function (DUF1990) [Fragilaria crotonensis]|nr:protein of unknown function (DUF1990) [Fragilaria crotonensis]
MMMPIRIVLLLILLVSPLATALPSRRVATRRTLFRSKQRNKCHGTHLSFRKPARDACSQWFNDDSSLQTCFNHATAGMTNPSLHIAVDNTVVLQISATSKTAANPKRQGNGGGWWWPESSPLRGAPERQGWRICNYERHVGQGRACYEAVRDQVLSWEFQTPLVGIVAVEHRPRHRRPAWTLRQETNPRGGFDIVHTGSSNGDDDTDPHAWRSTASAIRMGGDPQRLATYSRCLPLWWGGRAALWCTNPVQVVYDIVDQRGPSTTYTSSAYATTTGHWLAGEERLTVALRDEDGQVQVQLVSYSKPKSILTALTWPLVQRMQERFFESQLQWLQNVAKSAASVASPHDNHLTQPLTYNPMPQAMPLPKVSSESI